MIEVVPDLWLSECCAYGRVSNLKGAVEAGRVLVEKAGGFREMRHRVDEAEAKQKEKRARAS
jgi:hypothetical protein